MSNKSCPIFTVCLPDKNGQDFLHMLYEKENIVFFISLVGGRLTMVAGNFCLKGTFLVITARLLLQLLEQLPVDLLLAVGVAVAVLVVDLFDVLLLLFAVMVVKQRFKGHGIEQLGDKAFFLFLFDNDSLVIGHNVCLLQGLVLNDRDRCSLSLARQAIYDNDQGTSKLLNRHHRDIYV